MSFREYNPSSVPAEAWEVVDWIVETRLKPDDELEGMLMGVGRVFAHRITENPPSSGEWARVLFREPLNPANVRLPSTLVYDHPFDLMIEVANSDDPVWNPDRAAADIYSRVYALVVGQKPVLTRGNALIQFRADGRLRALMPDMVNHSFITNATFRCVLQPK